MLVLVKLPRSVPAFGLGGSFFGRALAQANLVAPKSFTTGQNVGKLAPKLHTPWSDAGTG